MALYSEDYYKKTWAEAEKAAKERQASRSKPAKSSSSSSAGSYKLSADTYKKYDDEYNNWKKTGKYSADFNTWKNDADLNAYKMIRSGKGGRSAFADGSYYVIDDETYSRYDDEYKKWKKTGQYSDDFASWKNDDDLAVYKAIRKGGQSPQDQQISGLDWLNTLDQDVLDRVRTAYQDGLVWDITDPEDMARKAAGQMPKNKDSYYNLNDPLDAYLYAQGLPSNKSNYLSKQYQKYLEEIEGERAEEAAYNQSFDRFKDVYFQTKQRYPDMADEDIIAQILRADEDGIYQEVANNLLRKGRENPEEMDSMAFIEWYENQDDKKENPREFTIQDLVDEYQRIYGTTPQTIEEAMEGVAVAEESGETVAPTAPIIFDYVMQAAPENAEERLEKVETMLTNMRRGFNGYERQIQRPADSGEAKRYDSLMLQSRQLRQMIAQRDLDKAKEKLASYDSVPVSYVPATQAAGSMSRKERKAISEILDDPGFGRSEKWNWWFNLDSELQSNRNFVPDPNRDQETNLSRYYTSKFMTDEEKGRFSYIVKNQGAEAALEYWDALEPILNERNYEQANAEIEKAVTDYPALASVGTIFAQIPSAVEGVVAQVGGWANVVSGGKVGREVTFNDPRLVNTYTSTGIRSGVSETIAASDPDVIFRNKDGEPAVTQGQLLAIAYDMGMSIADNAFRAGIATLTGGAGVAISSATMYGSTAASTTSQYLQEGASAKQALLMGTISGATEAIGEAIDLSQLFKLKNVGDLAKSVGGNMTKGQLIRRALIRQALTEGGSESATEIANMVADMIVMQDEAEVMKLYNEALDDGATKGQALWHVVSTKLGDVAIAGVGGAISGIVLGGGGIAGQGIKAGRAAGETGVSTLSKGLQYMADEANATARLRIVYEGAVKDGTAVDPGIRMQILSDLQTMGLDEKLAEGYGETLDKFMASPRSLSSNEFLSFLDTVKKDVLASGDVARGISIDQKARRDAATQRLTGQYNALMEMRDQARAALQSGDLKTHAKLMNQLSGKMQQYTESYAAEQRKEATAKAHDDLKQEKANRAVVDDMNELARREAAETAYQTEQLATAAAEAVVSGVAPSQEAQEDAAPVTGSPDTETAVQGESGALTKDAVDAGVAPEQAVVDTVAAVGDNMTEEGLVNGREEQNPLSGSEDVADIQGRGSAEETLERSESNSPEGKAVEGGRAPQAAEGTDQGTGRTRPVTLEGVINGREEQNALSGDGSVRGYEQDEASEDRRSRAAGIPRETSESRRTPQTAERADQGTGRTGPVTFDEDIRSAVADWNSRGGSQLSESDFTPSELEDNNLIDIMENVRSIGQMDASFYSSNRSDTPEGFTRNGRIYVKNTGSPVMAFQYGHEVAESSKGLRDVGYSLLNDLDKPDREALVAAYMENKRQNISDAYNISPDEVVLQDAEAEEKEMICDLFGAMVFETVSGYEGSYQMVGIDEETFNTFADAYTEALTEEAESWEDEDGTVLRNKYREIYKAGQALQASDDNAEFSVRSLLEAVNLDAKADDNGVLTVTRNGKPVSEISAQDVRSTRLGALIQRAEARGYISEAEAWEQREFVKDLTNMIIRMGDADLVWAFAGTQVFSAITNNADNQYGKTVDFTTICRKTQAIVDAMSAKMMAEQRGLTDEEITSIHGDLVNHGKSVPCKGCYVFSRWIGIGSLLGNIHRFQQEYADIDTAREALKDPKLDNKARAWIEQVRLKQNYKPVPSEILFDLNRGGEFASRYPVTWKYRTTRGPALGKAITPYAEMRVGEVIQGIRKNPNKILKGDKNPFFASIDGTLTKTAEKEALLSEAAMRRQNLLGGLRYQSTSDFRYEYALDYLLSFFDVQAVGGKIQTYTKVPEAVPLLASIGADVNLSIWPNGVGYVEKDGKLLMDSSSVEGMDFDTAVDLSNRYDNVQLIVVGINDTHIRLALENSDIGFVIPYHASGGKKEVIDAMAKNLGEDLGDGYQDYSDVQSDTVDPRSTPEQIAARNLRHKILVGKAKTLSAQEQGILDRNEHLNQLYRRFYEEGVDPNAYGVKLKSSQAGMIMPYEYWDTTTTIETADRNGERFKEYCESLGIIPRFSGKAVSGDKVRDVGFGNFADTPGYWKTLIDRPMYNNDGSYHVQQTINVSDIKSSMLSPEGAMSFEGIEPASRNESEKLDILDPKNVARFHKEVTQVVENQMPSSEMVMVGKPPAILQKYMSSDKTMYLPQSAIRKGIYPRGINGGKHNLGRNVINDLPRMLSKPVAITGNTQRHKDTNPERSVVVWTYRRSEAGDPIIAPIRIDVKSGGLEYNTVKSVFDAYDEAYADGLLKEENILYPEDGKEDIRRSLTQQREVLKGSAPDVFANTVTDSGEESKTSAKNSQFSSNPVSTDLKDAEQKASDLFQADVGYMDYINGRAGRTDKDTASYLRGMWDKTDSITRLRKATQLFRDGVQPVEYWENCQKTGEKFDKTVAGLLRGMYLRGGKSQGGKLAENELNDLLRNKGNFAQVRQSRLSLRSPVRIFEEMGAWRKDNTAANRAANWEEGQRFRKTFWDYVLTQVAARNRYAKEWEQKIRQAFANGSRTESTLIQLLGEEIVTEAEARNAIGDKNHFLVQRGDGWFVFDKERNLIAFGDSKQTVAVGKDYQKAVASKAVNRKALNPNRKESLVESIVNRTRAETPFSINGAITVERHGNNATIHLPGKADPIVISNGRGANMDIVLNTRDALRAFYDDAWLQQTRVRVENGYAPPGRIENYFPHQGKELAGIERMLANDLPTAISGLTAKFKPGTPWSRNLLERLGEDTEFDAIRGFNNYIGSAGDVIFMTPAIQRLRQLEQKLRDVTGSVNNELAKWVGNYANSIANKKASLDRGVEDQLGREVYSIADALTNVFSRAAVSGNVSSAMSNLISLVTALPSTEPGKVVKGGYNTITNGIARLTNNPDDGFVEKIPFLTARYENYDRILTSNWDRFKNKTDKVAMALFMAVDRFSCETVARAKYDELMSKGLTEKQAVEQTNAFCNKLFSDKSKGMAPTVFGSKMLKPFAQFQAEALNQMSHFRDIKREGIDRKAIAYAKEAGLNMDELGIDGLEKALSKSTVPDELIRKALYLVLLSLYGMFTRATQGRDQTWNPGGMAVDAVRDYKEGGFKQAITGLTEATIDNLAFVSIFTNGGRIPVMGGFDNLKNFLKSIASGNDGNTIALAGVKAVGSFVPGGGQISKTIRGADAVRKGGYYTKDGRLMYPVEQDDYWRILLFGPSAAAPEGYDYTESLSEKETAVYQDLTEQGYDPMDLYLTLLGATGSANAEKALSLAAKATEIGAGYSDKDYGLIGAALGLKYDPEATDKNGNHIAFTDYAEDLKEQREAALGEDLKKGKKTQAQVDEEKARLDEYWDIIVGNRGA